LQDLMMEYLQPYLNSPYAKVRERAVFMEKKFNKE